MKKQYTPLNTSFRSKGSSADKSFRTAGEKARSDAPLERMRLPLFVRVMRRLTGGRAAR